MDCNCPKVWGVEEHFCSYCGGKGPGYTCVIPWCKSHTSYCEECSMPGAQGGSLCSLRVTTHFVGGQCPSCPHIIKWVGINVPKGKCAVCDGGCGKICEEGQHKMYECGKCNISFCAECVSPEKNGGRFPLRKAYTFAGGEYPTVGTTYTAAGATAKDITPFGYRCIIS